MIISEPPNYVPKGALNSRGRKNGCDKGNQFSQ